MNGYNNNKYKQRKHYEIEDPKFSFFNHNIYVVLPILSNTHLQNSAARNYQ